LKDGIPNVFIVDIDGVNKRQITTRKTPCGRVRWSPDGKQLSFVSFEGKYPQLFVVPITSGEPRQLTNLDGAVYFANWRGK
jgi:TolB protein